MPHILSKIDRVSFGLLSPADLARALAVDPFMPRSRRLLAVPFVGKDVPSRASEFSHPDVVIGMTILAYRQLCDTAMHCTDALRMHRYEGLRTRDFLNVMRGLRDSMEDEHGPYNKRPSCKAFVRWVTLAGGSVRGVGNAGLHSLKALNNNTATTATASTTSMPHQQQPSVSLLDMSVAQPDTISTTTAMQTLSEADISQNDSDEYHDLWPLQLIDLKDEDMIGTLYRLLRHLPQVIEYYLDTYIFPETMEHQGLKLAANGQDVGGDMLFKTKLGFSGTPSDLLPVELGRCQFEMGNTAMMLHYLTDTQMRLAIP
eukprot:18856-Heterococcus_DN1.PRE.2